MFRCGLGPKNEERQVKDRAENDASKRAGRGFNLISRAVKTESLLPRSFFAPKPNGNACYAGYIMCKKQASNLKQMRLN